MTKETITAKDVGTVKIGDVTPRIVAGVGTTVASNSKSRAAKLQGALTGAIEHAVKIGVSVEDAVTIRQFQNLAMALARAELDNDGPRIDAAKKAYSDNVVAAERAVAAKNEAAAKQRAAAAEEAAKPAKK